VVTDGFLAGDVRHELNLLRECLHSQRSCVGAMAVGTSWGTVLAIFTIGFLVLLVLYPSEDVCRRVADAADLQHESDHNRAEDPAVSRCSPSEKSNHQVEGTGLPPRRQSGPFQTTSWSAPRQSSAQRRQDERRLSRKGEWSRIRQPLAILGSGLWRTHGKQE